MLLFEEKEHVYTWNNKVVSSVTQIMGKVGIKSNKKDGSEVWLPIGGSNQFFGDNVASDFGTAFHDYAKFNLQGIKNIQYDNALSPWINQYNKFIKSLGNFKILGVEEALYSTRYKYAGTFDLIVELENGSIVIIDWKTSTSFQKKWRIQTAAYEQLYRENYKIRKKIHRWAVRISDKNFEVDKRFNNSEDWYVFQSCLNLINYK